MRSGGCRVTGESYRIQAWAGAALPSSSLSRWPIGRSATQLDARMPCVGTMSADARFRQDGARGPSLLQCARTGRTEGRRGRSMPELIASVAGARRFTAVMLAVALAVLY